MELKKYPSFNKVNNVLFDEFKRRASQPVETQRWQGVDVSDKPEMQMHELLYVSFEVDLCGMSDLDHFRKDIAPTLPWADDHFDERVCGWPINPGVQWKSWGNADSAAGFLDETGKFNHNYMERYWPKYARYAGYSETVHQAGFNINRAVGYSDSSLVEPIEGIRHEYGDLNNVVNLLANEPRTRQAILPVWFPEDTGDVHSGRKPCTISYHFMCRENRLDMVYYIRSCDFIRHFRDDIYLTLRLQLWMLQECRKIKPEFWDEISMGRFIMHIDSLHMFRNDFYYVLEAKYED